MDAQEQASGQENRSIHIVFVATVEIKTGRLHSRNIIGIFSAYGGDTTVARLLLDAGADVNAKARNGWTALRLAAHRNKFATVQLLKRAGAKK